MMHAICIFFTGIALLAAAEKPTIDPLDTAIEGVIQFSFDWPQKTFQQVRESEPVASERWCKATFGLATCLHQASPPQPDNIATAAELFRSIAEQAPESVFAPRSELNLGRIAELSDYYKDPIDLTEARLRYQHVIATWSDQPIAGEATLRLAVSHVHTNQASDVAIGITTLTNWLTTHPADPLASAMWHYLGDTYFMQQQQYQAAMEAYINADNIGLMWEGRESIVWWRMARIAESHLNNPKLAITYYTRICQDAQTSGRAFEAQIALARLGAPVPELSAFKAYPGKRPILPGETPTPTAPATEVAP